MTLLLAALVASVTITVALRGNLPWEGVYVAYGLLLIVWTAVAYRHGMIL